MRLGPSASRSAQCSGNISEYSGPRCDNPGNRLYNVRPLAKPKLCQGFRGLCYPVSNHSPSSVCLHSPCTRNFLLLLALFCISSRPPSSGWTGTWAGNVSADHDRCCWGGDTIPPRAIALPSALPSMSRVLTLPILQMRTQYFAQVLTASKWQAWGWTPQAGDSVCGTVPSFPRTWTRSLPLTPQHESWTS